MYWKLSLPCFAAPLLFFFFLIYLSYHMNVEGDSSVNRVVF